MLSPEGDLSLKGRMKRRLMSKMAGKRFCPNCGSEEIEMLEEEGLNGMLACMDCDFKGNVFPQKELIGDADTLEEEVEEDLKEIGNVKIKKSKNSKISKAKKSKIKARKNK